MAQPGTSYSEYPVREVTRNSVFADGSFCTQNEAIRVANAILLDGEENVPPPLSSDCPCIDEGTNPVFQLIDIGNETSATVTRFRPATSHFDSCKQLCQKLCSIQVITSVENAAHSRCLFSLHSYQGRMRTFLRTSKTTNVSSDGTNWMRFLFHFTSRCE